MREYNKKYRAKNREELAEYDQHRWRNVPHRKEQHNKAVKRHRDKAYAANPEKFRSRARRFKKVHRGYYTQLQRLRVHGIKQATPAWVDMQAIVQFYDNCPSGLHVDHIIPLNGENVCGLHVPWNLQYLTPSENARKSNKCLG